MTHPNTKHATIPCKIELKVLSISPSPISLEIKELVPTPSDFPKPIINVTNGTATLLQKMILNSSVIPKKHLQMSNMLQKLTAKVME